MLLRRAIWVESGTPVMGYTMSYAVSNVILTFLGPIIVFAV